MAAMIAARLCHFVIRAIRTVADSARVTVAPFREAVSRISSRYARPGWLLCLWLGRVAGGGDWAGQPLLALRGGPGGGQGGGRPAAGPHPRRERRTGRRGYRRQQGGPRPAPGTPPNE